MRRIVLYGIGSPLVIDAEETCARAGIEIAAGVRNVDGDVYVTGAVRVVTPDELTAEDKACAVLVVLFTPGHRRAAYDEARRAGFAHAATVIDPTSPVARSAVLGEGVYVNAGAVIGGECRMGERVIVNRSASIGHHTRIGDYVSIGPAAVLGGLVTVGRGAVIGLGAVVLPGIAIGDNAVVGAGSVVRDNVAANTLVLGNPAQVVKTGIAGYKGLAV